MIITLLIHRQKLSYVHRLTLHVDTRLCLFIGLSNYLSIDLSIIYLSIYLPSHPCLPIYKFIYLPIYQDTYLSVYLSV